MWEGDLSREKISHEGGTKSGKIEREKEKNDDGNALFKYAS